MSATTLVHIIYMTSWQPGADPAGGHKGHVPPPESHKKIQVVTVWWRHCASLRCQRSWSAVFNGDLVWDASEKTYFYEFNLSEFLYLLFVCVLSVVSHYGLFSTIDAR